MSKRKRTRKVAARGRIAARRLRRSYSESYKELLRARDLGVKFKGDDPRRLPGSRGVGCLAIGALCIACRPCAFGVDARMRAIQW